MRKITNQENYINGQTIQSKFLLSLLIRRGLLVSYLIVMIFYCFVNTDVSHSYQGNSKKCNDCIYYTIACQNGNK